MPIGDGVLLPPVEVKPTIDYIPQILKDARKQTREFFKNIVSPYDILRERLFNGGTKDVKDFKGYLNDLKLGIMTNETFHAPNTKVASESYYTVGYGHYCNGFKANHKTGKNDAVNTYNLGGKIFSARAKLSEANAQMLLSQDIMDNVAYVKTLFKGSSMTFREFNVLVWIAFAGFDGLYFKGNYKKTIRAYIDRVPKHDGHWKLQANMSNLLLSRNIVNYHVKGLSFAKGNLNINSFDIEEVYGY